jgi:hypothetical protein
MRKDHSFNTARRQVLRMLGLGAAGTAISAVVASDGLFAKQFADEVPRVKVPEMTYDPQLQMMVDPVSRRPIYLNPQKVATSDATVTAACPSCPRCDDYCTD